MTKDKLLKIFYLFLLIQPFIDLITSLMTRFLSFPITLGTIIRGFIFLISIVYIILFSKSSYKKLSIFYLGLLFLFSILYFITKPSLFSNYSYLFTEFMYMFKYYYTLIMLLALLNFFDQFKPNNRKVFKILQVDLFLYCFIIVLANITGTAFGTYSYGGLGNTGWFYSGNEISVIVALLFPLLYLLVNKSSSYKILCYIIPIVLGIEFIGTKTSMLGLLIPTLVFLFYYLIRFKSKRKQFIMTAIILVIIVISSPNLPVVQNIKDSISRYNVRENTEEIDEDYSTEVVSSVLLSDRDYYEKKIIKIYNKADFVDKLFGIGFTNRTEIDDEHIEKLIEMDFHDIFYRHGIIGFVIYILPFVLITIKVILLCLKHKLRLNVKQLILGYIPYIGLAISLTAGHVLGAPAVAFYLVLTFALLLYYLEYDQYKIKINENKVTILALHLGTGGIEKYISSLCKMLEDDYEIEIISTYKINEKPAFYFSDKITIKYLINDYPHKKEFKNAINDKNIILILKYGFSLTKLLLLKYVKNINCIEELNSKYIITTRYFHNKLVGGNKNRDIVAIATEHNYHNNDKKYIKKVCDSCNNIDYFVLVSKELKDFYNKKLRNTKTKCIYIPNVIDEIPNYRKKQNIENKLISIGRLSEEKGYEDLIDIISIIKKEIANIHLDIYGDGLLKDKLNQKIQNLNLEDNVTLCGFCEYKKLYNKIKEYDIYLMSSHTESFGLVLLEAMSQSVPCIGFDSANGVKNLLKDGNGILISNRNKEKYAKEVIKLLNDKNKLISLSKKGYDYVKKYDIEVIKNKWLELLKNSK